MSNVRVHLGRPLILSLAFAAAFAIGCGASADGPIGDVPDAAIDVGADSPLASDWGSHRAVGELFEDHCSSCHSDQFDACSNVQAGAGAYESVISSGGMPRGATLPAADKATMLAWLTAGAPCGSN